MRSANRNRPPTPVHSGQAEIGAYGRGVIVLAENLLAILLLGNGLLVSRSQLFSTRTYGIYMSDHSSKETTVKQAINAALLIHAIAWSGTEQDGKTGRVGCFCGWEGTPANFDVHCRECADAK